MSTFLGRTVDEAHRTTVVDPSSGPGGERVDYSTCARVVETLLEDEGMPLVDRLVLTMLSLHLNRETGDAWPGVDRLARLAACDRRTIQRSLRRLEASGRIAAADAARGGKGMRTHFVLFPRGVTTDAVSPSARGVSGDAPRTSKGVTGVPAGASLECSKGVTQVLPIKQGSRTTNHQEGDDDGSRLDQALRILADRRADRATITSSRSGYVARTLETLRSDHGDRAQALEEEHPEWDAAQIADELEPPRVDPTQPLARRELGPTQPRWIELDDGTVVPAAAAG